MSDKLEIDENIKIFISVVFGEASEANSFEEMAAIAAVLERQRKARGFGTWKEFKSGDPSYAFGFNEAKNPRTKMLINTGVEKIPLIEPMATAYRAVQYVLDGGADLSNGAFFWDGYDLKTNYKHHPKVKLGIKFSAPEHNIFDVEETTTTKWTRYEVTVEKGKKTKRKDEEKTADHTYVSTAAYKGIYNRSKTIHQKNSKGKMESKIIKIQAETGTVFWKFDPKFVQFWNVGKREYK